MRTFGVAPDTAVLLSLILLCPSLLRAAPLPPAPAFAAQNGSARPSLSPSSGAPAPPSAAPAQPSATPRYLHVEAPYAQQLVLAAKAKHPELKKIGMHAVPPGEAESAIIANPITSKIGKLSSANDLAVVRTGKAVVTPHEEEGGFFDLGMPLADAQGRVLGMMVMEIPYRVATTQDEALAMGERIRDEVSAQIPGKASLFQSGPPQMPVPRAQ